MKVVILNGSPRKGGNTEIMAETFAKAADKHEVEILNIAPMNIKGCLGCKYCYAHQGECVQKDDMEKLLDFRISQSVCRLQLTFLDGIVCTSEHLAARRS